MAGEVVNLFCLLFWYDQERNWSIQNCSTIVKPRRDPQDYKGELVLAKFQGKTFNTAIGRVKENKEHLKEDVAKLEGLLKDTTLSLNTVMEKMGLPAMEIMAQDFSGKKDESAVKKTSEILPKSSGTRKRAAASTDMDEAKQAKKDASIQKCATEKKRKESAVAASQDLLSERIDISSQLDQLTAAVRKQNDVLQKFTVLMDTFQCRECIKSMYKGAKKSSSGEVLCKSPPPAGMITSPAAPPTRHPNALNFDVEAQGARNATANETAEIPKEASPALDPLQPTSVVTESDEADGLVSLGDARHGIMMNKMDLMKCVNHSATSSKLALNLLDFLITAEVCTNMTVYGHGKDKVPMNQQLRRAIRSHVFSIYDKNASEEEKSSIWSKIVYKLNDKIRALKNGKYKGKLKLLAAV